MSELISGKDALIALANGEEVEVKHPHDKWYENWESLNSSGGKFFLLYLLDETTGYQFRLKPRTITINGIEVPAPFEPKEDCQVWIIDDGKTDNCRKYNYEVEGDKINIFIGVWRTEYEIKQVVSALHSIFKGGV